jgi:hypothetical protein
MTTASALAETSDVGNKCRISPSICSGWVIIGFRCGRRNHSVNGGHPNRVRGVTVLPEGEAGTSLQAIAVTGRRVR